MLTGPEYIPIYLQLRVAENMLFKYAYHNDAYPHTVWYLNILLSYSSVSGKVWFLTYDVSKS